MRYETLAPVHEIYSASVLFSIYFSVSVICIYIKKEQPKRKVTEGDQSLSDDWGWHFVILSLAREGPPLIPCINTSFIFCHHRLHCANDVMTRPRGIPAAAPSALAAPSSVGPIQLMPPEFGSHALGFCWEQMKSPRSEGGARGLPSSACHALVPTRFIVFSS